MYNQVISYVIGTSKSNAAPFFLLLLKASIPSTAKDMKLEDLAFHRLSDITQTLDRYVGDDIWGEIKRDQSFFTRSQINAFRLREVTEA
jgi:hypothetical protein